MPIDEQVDAAPTGGSVLVVDDDPFIARLLEIELKAAGYDVRVANDGARALDLSRERCPDLVLADVMMPTMDGFELTRRLRGDSRTASTSDHADRPRASSDKLEGSLSAPTTTSSSRTRPSLRLIRGDASPRRCASSHAHRAARQRASRKIEGVRAGALFAIPYAD
jgi:CheY-like chemotaxis protein